MVAEGSQRPVDDLEGLARARFGELSKAELELLHAAPKGAVAWCGPTEKDDDPANDPAKADEWGHEREIRADLIRWLCVDRDAKSAVDPKGIRVHGARIPGRLDLSSVRVPFPLLLRRCRLTEHANLTSAGLPALDLAGSRAQSVTAEGAVVNADLSLEDGFRAEGEVRLLGAQIGGDLACRRGTFKSADDALSADGANVKGAVFLSDGFSTEGTVRLLGAQIGSNLDCRGGTFRNPGKKALSADRADVKGSVFLSSGFSAEGEVRLLGVQIGGSLDCSGGTFKNPGQDALYADRANVKGGVFLRDGFSVEGTVRLLGAQIGGDVGCPASTFKNPGKNALSADGAEVKGSFFLGEGFGAEGTVRLPGAQIGGNLDCDGGRLSEVKAENAVVRGTLFWRGVEATSLDLINASAGSLVDDEKSWPHKGKLFLDGFIYDHISGDSPRDAKTRLRWLELQDPFAPKPYRQLAKVLREAGDDSGARKVLFEMERRRRQVEDRRWYARAWGWLLKWAIGYGFYPWRAVVGLAALAIIGLGLFWFGYSRGAMTPTDKEAYCFFRTQGRPPDYYQRFTASVYSIENSLPFVNLGQKDHWTPDPNQQGWWRLASFLRGFRWGQILLGWLLATLFVAGMTGVVRKE
jgi:hypothetical protein